ncbi:MAG: 4-hydroxy-3-methylbut-2-enyl diphosphate reductase [Desulfuromonadaceae bacterium]|nr:4-hydroxy-3-methylbut-2-enyl diphosphate reductase [Desulfuromonadaceae bacterium]
MKIILARSAGFCFGVKRAVNMAFQAAESAGHICSLGPLIHSPQLVARLEGEGIRVVNSVESMTDETVIIRSHGVTRDEEECLRRKQLPIVDATCPFVKKAQEYAELLGREGYSVVIVGEAEHPEVQGIVSYVQAPSVFVVADVADVRALRVGKKVGLVAQTTQAYENFHAIAQELIGRCKELRIFNTICDATAVRQNEAREVAAVVDVMLVIGGHNSANTNRLARICSDIQPKTYHIETASEIDNGWLDGVKTVGLTAGASTPEWIISEVVEKLKELAK